MRQNFPFCDQWNLQESTPQAVETSASSLKSYESFLTSQPLCTRTHATSPFWDNAAKSHSRKGSLCSFQRPELTKTPWVHNSKVRHQNTVIHSAGALLTVIDRCPAKVLRAPALRAQLLAARTSHLALLPSLFLDLRSETPALRWRWQTGLVDLNHAIKIKNHAVSEICAIFMTHWISILIGFHICSISVEGRVLMTTHVKSHLKLYQSQQLWGYTDSMPFNCKNDMCTEVTNPCRFRSHNCYNATCSKV